jgi:hypothetical protein
MKNQPAPEGLIVPRRRTEDRRHPSEPTTAQGVPIISSIPAVDQPGRTDHTARIPRRVVESAPRVGMTRVAVPRVAAPPAASRTVEAESKSREALEQGDVERCAAVEPEKIGPLAMMANYSWNSLFLGFGLAALLMLTFLAAVRSGTLVAPSTPPSVHTQVVSPTPHASESMANADGGTDATRHNLADPQRRLALRDSRPVATAALPLDEPNHGLTSDGQSTDPSIDTRVDTDSIKPDSEYPATEFPDLPPPPHESKPSPTPGARLNGTIQKFKK